jgi:hypothetical protein
MMHVGKATDLKVRDAKIEEMARYTLSDRGCGLGLLCQPVSINCIANKRHRSCLDKEPL